MTIVSYDCQYMSEYDYMKNCKKNKACWSVGLMRLKDNISVYSKLKRLLVGCGLKLSCTGLGFLIEICNIILAI